MQSPFTAITENSPGAGKPNTRQLADHRLRPQHRLPDKSSFSRVFEKAQRSRDAVFTVLFRPNDEAEPRLGLAISRKNCRQASGRNRLKRVIRESFRKHRAELGGIDIVVLSRPEASTRPNDALYASLENHWRRCRAMKDDAGPTS